MGSSLWSALVGQDVSGARLLVDGQRTVLRLREEADEHCVPRDLDVVGDARRAEVSLPLRHVPPVLGARQTELQSSLLDVDGLVAVVADTLEEGARLRREGGHLGADAVSREQVPLRASPQVSERLGEVSLLN